MDKAVKKNNIEARKSNLGRMTEIRSIEKAKKRLCKAEIALLGSIKMARKSIILSLNAELKTSNLALKAAKKRHSQLKNLTRAICDDCWVILLTVSKEVQTVEGVFLLKRVQS